MAKKSQINRNAKREKMVAQYAPKRKALKAVTENMSLPPEERFAAHLKLAKLPRNSSKTRIHHRCEMTGRPRAYYRKLGYDIRRDFAGVTKIGYGTIVLVVPPSLGVGSVQETHR